MGGRLGEPVPRLSGDCHKWRKKSASAIPALRHQAAEPAHAGDEQVTALLHGVALGVKPRHLARHGLAVGADAAGQFGMGRQVLDQGAVRSPSAGGSARRSSSALSRWRTAMVLNSKTRVVSRRTWPASWRATATAKPGCSSIRARKRLRGSLAMMQGSTRLDTGRARQAVDGGDLAEHHALRHLAKAHALAVGRIKRHARRARHQQQHVETRVGVADHQLALGITLHDAVCGDGGKRRLAHLAEQRKDLQVFLRNPIQYDSIPRSRPEAGAHALPATGLDVTTVIRGRQLPCAGNGLT